MLEVISRYSLVEERNASLPAGWFATLAPDASYLCSFDRRELARERWIAGYKRQSLRLSRDTSAYNL